ncbi:MAG: hypothetical protein ABWY22_11115 [Flavobacterium sp.]
MRHKADFVNVVASFLAMTNWIEKLELKTSFYPECPSPDSSGNPFVSRFFNETQKIVTDSGISS